MIRNCLRKRKFSAPAQPIGPEFSSWFHTEAAYYACNPRRTGHTIDRKDVHMQTLRMAALGMALVTGFTLATVARSQEKRISKNEVPTAVLSAFQQAHPEAKVKGYAREVEEGKTYYEIESMNGKSSLDVLYLADGTVAEVEEGVAAADLPAPVREALSTKYPKLKIVKAEKTTRGDAVTFELQITSGKARTGLVVDPSGRIVKESTASGTKKERIN